MRLSLSPDQMIAAGTLLTSDARELSLAGPAGSGKTTLISHLIDGLAEKHGPDSTLLITPTNKAAQVLQAKGLTQATTLYKPFFVPVRKRGVPGFSLIPACDYRGSLPPGKTDFFEGTLIIDEASMLSTWVVSKLRRMCKAMILVGDPHQLPPVKDEITPAGYFNTRKHDASLKQIHRQKEGSSVLAFATAIRTRSPNINHYLRSFQAGDTSFAEAIRLGYQFIAYTNKERQKINTLAKRYLHGEGLLPVPGEKMLSSINYDDNLINGTPVTCLAFDWDERSPLARITVDWGGGVQSLDFAMAPYLKDLPYHPYRLALQSQDDEDEEEDPAFSATLGYCLTAHKAQGSEYQRVAVIDQRDVIEYMANRQGGQTQSNALAHLTAEDFSRRWLYTAVTRAREDLIVTHPGWANIDEGGLL